MVAEAEVLGASHAVAEVTGLLVERNNAGMWGVVGVRTTQGDVRALKVALCMGPWTHRATAWLPEGCPQLPRVDGDKAHSITMRPQPAANITPHAIFIDYHGKGKMQHPEIYPRPG